MPSNLQYTVITAFSAGNLADNTCLSGKTAGQAFWCQVSAADVVIDNTASPATRVYIDFELVLGSPASAWAVGDRFNLFALPSLDGTNYAYGTGTLPPPASNYLIASFDVTTAAETSARRLIIPGRVLTPGKYKFVGQNSTSRTLATTSTLSYQIWTDQFS